MQRQSIGEWKYPFRVRYADSIWDLCALFNPDLDLIGRMGAAMLLLDGTGRRLVGNIHNIIHMLAHRDEQIEKPEWQDLLVRYSMDGYCPGRCDSQPAPTNLHLHLHGSTPLEDLATPDNQS